MLSDFSRFLAKETPEFFEKNKDGEPGKEPQKLLKPDLVVFVGGPKFGVCDPCAAKTLKTVTSLNKESRLLEFHFS